MTSTLPTMLPWVLIDPALSDWGEPCLAEGPTRSAAEFLRRYCSVIIGELDYESIVERANDGRDSSYRLLREALLRCPVHRRGLSLDEPKDVLESGTSDIQPRAALVDSSRLAAIEMLARQNAKVLTGASELVFSTFRREVEEAHIRLYNPGAEPVRVWKEVLEPFTRASVLNVYESFIFSPFTWDDPDIRSTGLGWFLDQLASRAARDDRPIDVVVRGGFDYVKGNYPAVQREMRKRCAELVASMLPNVRLHLEPIERAPHDRWMLARRPDQSSRLLENAYPVISNLGKRVGAPWGQPLPKVVPYRFTYDDKQGSVGVREREWGGMKSKILFTEGPI